MKVQSKKIVFGLSFIVFMIILGISVNIANKTPDTTIKGTAIEIEEDIKLEEEITEDTTTDEIAEEKEEYLKEEIEDNELLASSEDDKKATMVQEQTAPTKSTEPKVDMSPINGERYTVKNGDTLFYIAQRAKISVAKLKEFNNLNGDVINVGQTLLTKSSPKTTNVAATNSSVSRGATREDDIYWLSRIIHAEAQGESYQGKVAVGNVILNRVSNSKFPNSIYGVIFDKQDGYTQFSPVLDGSIYNTPNKESIKAATEALNGARPVGSALYFLNPRKSTNFWIVENRKHMTTIGEHDFYY